ALHPFARLREHQFLCRKLAELLSDSHRLTKQTVLYRATPRLRTSEKKHRTKHKRLGSGLPPTNTSVGGVNRTMTQPTSRLWKCYLTKKESDGVLHQITWPPQSPDFNPIEIVWDELDRRVKEKQPTSAQHMWELLQDC
uniref:Tc1-like transposase DDE domain-containing protein n=1 Tax=Oncorhynchus tshawytscha TaxID=74940 RepID=A0AAZ3SUD3_ONCTS